MSKKIFFLLFTFLLVSSNAMADSRSFDHSLFDQFLKKYVNERGEVNYQQAAQDPSLLNQYLEKLKQVQMGTKEMGWPREERLALWLNAYHAGMIHLVLKHYPVKSLLDIPGIWDVEVIQVGKRHYSLNNIRQGELIGTFRDEKIDSALACGAKSCPELPREAFTGPQVEGQLFLATQRFVNDPVRNPVGLEKKSIFISKIFKWYGSDFKLDFSSEDRDRRFTDSEYAVLSFLANYLKDEKKIQFLEEGQYKIKYVDFDWSLNETHPESARP